jgi:molecular chaperone Hsp33
MRKNRFCSGVSTSWVERRSTSPILADVTHDIDRTLGFAIASRHARGRVARLGPVLDAVLAAHSYPPAIERLLAEALVLTALLGSLLKDDAGQMTLQAQTEAGIVELLVCDYRAGEVRGYVRFDADRLAEGPSDPSLFALFGRGYLAITFDQAVSGERYQGIVPLEGASLADAAQSYFAQSEQIPSLVRIAVGRDGEGCKAGGLLLQHLPEGEEGRDRLHTRLDHPEWEHVAIMGGTIADDELLGRDLPLETIVWRLFNEEEEVRLLGGAALSRGCRCDAVHIRDVLGQFPAGERATMADGEGVISVDCAFCSRVFPVAARGFTMNS